jgi:SAM-dependent methyltransferase
MSEKRRFNPPILEQWRQHDRKEAEFYKGPGKYIDSITSVTPGSFLGRTLDQYQEVLCGGAPVLIERPRALRFGYTVVDAGCGAGLALFDIRDQLPLAKLIGVDVRNVTRRVGEIFQQAGIEFRQGIFLDVNELVPEGYDLLLSVAGFYDYTTPNAPIAEGLELFHEGLREGGKAFVFLSITEGMWQKAQEKLTKAKVPYSFYPGDPTILGRNSFASGAHPGELQGTVLIGPKAS